MEIEIHFGWILISVLLFSIVIQESVESGDNGKKAVNKKTFIIALIAFGLLFVILTILVAIALVPDKEPNESQAVEPTPPAKYKPTPVGISNFVGIGYNIISGNPEGGDLHTGGVDPGFLVTRPIFKLTYNDVQLTSDLQYQVPDQVVFTPRSSCVSTSSHDTVYGTESYVNKLSVDVSVSGMQLYRFVALFFIFYISI